MQQTELQNLFSYNEVTGELVWKNPISTKFRKGDIAGSKRADGYIQIKLSGRMYLAHRIAWLYAYGSEVECIDHINHDRADNRLSNLRAATKSQNGANRKKCVSNTTGYKGVTRKGTKFTAALIYQGKRQNMGYFDTPEKAHTAYRLGAYLFHGEFAYA